MGNEEEILHSLEVIKQQQETIISRQEASDDRMKRMENRLAELSGSLAVVLDRSKDTKKKPTVLSDSFAKIYSRAWPGWKSSSPN